MTNAAAAPTPRTPKPLLSAGARRVERRRRGAVADAINLAFVIFVDLVSVCLTGLVGSLAPALGYMCGPYTSVIKVVQPVSSITDTAAVSPLLCDDWFSCNLLLQSLYCRASTAHSY